MSGKMHHNNKYYQAVQRIMQVCTTAYNISQQLTISHNSLQYLTTYHNISTYMTNYTNLSMLLPISPQQQQPSLPSLLPNKTTKTANNTFSFTTITVINITTAIDPITVNREDDEIQEARNEIVNFLSAWETEYIYNMEYSDIEHAVKKKRKKKRQKKKN